jgi:hypothetical protein
VAESSSEIATAAGLIRLVTGSREAAWSCLCWRDLAELAARERCIALAWLRSSDIIARHADPELAAWWRDLALRTLARGHAHVSTLEALIDSLASVGVRAVVLKGTPLSAMLYGEPGARGSADLDLWLPFNNRRQARDVLLDDGWTHADGGEPDDEAFVRGGPHGDEYLEIHSRLLHHRLDYLTLPDPEFSEVRVADARLPVMTGALLPGYLAAHDACHRFAPALWLFDCRALWERLDEDARGLARWTARRAGLQRYLDWAVRRAELLDRVAEGDPSAAERVGLRRQRRDVHPMWRHIRLAPSIPSALRAAGAWLMPSWATSRHLGRSGLIRRLRRHWRAALRTSVPPRRASPGVAIGARELIVVGEHLLRVVREVSLAGGRMWINTTGASMFPTLLESDCVLLEPAARVNVGDIVLVDAAGSPLLHRIVRMHGDDITTRGDARMTPDATVGRSDVLARAVRARRGDLEWSLQPSGWRRLRLRTAAPGWTGSVVREPRAHV